MSLSTDAESATVFPLTIFSNVTKVEAIGLLILMEKQEFEYVHRTKGPLTRDRDS